MITIDHLKQVEIKIGEIISAHKVEGADKLLKLEVNFGDKKSVITPVSVEGGVATSLSQHEFEKDVRQIISGIALFFPDPAVLIGVKCAFVTNLEPRTIRGLESNGMILATGGGTEPFTLLRADKDTVPGSLVR
jgi:methionyl-tRNA synthetase